MADIEKIQMERYYDELEDDLRHLIKKYCRIMGWSIPDINEQTSRELILESLQKVLVKLQSEK